MSAAGGLRHLYPGWYATVMGLAGLALAWHRAVPLMGEPAASAAAVLALLAGIVFVALAVFTVLRALRHPEAWAEDRRHPVRHTFVATLPVGAMLVATACTATLAPHPVLQALWWLGAIGQLVVTWWVLSRWWKPAGGSAGIGWASITPGLFIPIVGNVLAPLGGVAYGHTDWSAAQFGIGLLFWPMVTALLLVRLVVQGPWPERLRPSVFIFIAPPAAVGLAALQLGAPPMLGWICWGIALFSAAWVAVQAKAIAAMPFGISHWALSFPLAALAALSLRLAEPGSALAVLAPMLLALASLVIAALVVATLRGLRDGTLPAAEPVATIALASPGSAASTPSNAA